LGQAAKEALAVQGYSQRKFGISTFRRLLGFETRWEAEKWLSERGIAKNYSVADFKADCETLRSLTAEKH
jgi:predicted HTH domain antitoxin